MSGRGALSPPCRSNYKLALEEHNAALDTAGVKYEAGVNLNDDR